jgi:diguanylate cyclase (GGDEF)-like protein
MPIQNKILLLLFSIFSMLFSSLVLSAGHEQQLKHPLEPVTLQIKWKPQFQFAGYYAAIEQGFYQQEGLDVTIRPLLSNYDVISSVVSGETEYAVGGSGILAHYANGMPIKALAAIFQHDALVFLSKTSSNIISPYEMKGKRIMFDGTSGDDAPLTAMLADANLGLADYIHVKRSFGTDKLINDEVDVMSAYITNQPYQLKQQGLKLNIINPQSYGFDFYGDILYTSQFEIDNHRGRANRFRRASLKGWQYALDHPEELIQLLKHKYNSELSIDALRYEAQETRKLILPDVIPLGTIEIKRLQRVADTYAALNIAKPLDDLTLNNFIFNSNTLKQFTAKELAWLNKHPVIRVGVDRDFAPYEWIDEQGQYRGIAADYISLLEKRLGVHFEIIGDKPWHEIQQMAYRGELDMLSCLNKTLDRAKYLDFTPNYVANPIVIVNARRNGYIGSLTNLTGKTVAIERGYFTHENLEKNYPDIKLLVVNSTGEALDKVVVGEADAYVGDAAYTNYAMKKQQLLSLQFAGQTPDSSAYRIGTHKSVPELHSIITKSLNTLSQEDRQAIEAYWMGLTIQSGVERDTIIKVSLVVALIFLAFLYRLYRLRQTSKVLQTKASLLELAKENFHTQIDALNKIITVDSQQLEIARVSVWLLNHDNSAITCQALYNQGEISNEALMLESKDYPHYFKTLNDSGFIAADDAHLDPSTTEFTEHYLIPLGITSMMDTPIRIQGKVIGIVCHEHIGAKRQWTLEEEEFTRSIADLCSQVVLENDRKQQQEKLNLMAHYDVLTGLPNRALFTDRFNQSIAHSNRTENILAVCFLDLDNFKLVNDNYGHEVGDKLLIQVSHRLKETIRDEDTVSRQGGDEFALLLNDIESDYQCIQTIERVHQALAQPYIIDDIPHNITASTGMSLYPLDDGGVDTLLRHADQAMYQAKLAGRNQYQFFNAHDDKQAIDRQVRLQEIRQAITNNEFHLYYQPKVNIRTGKVFGAEALIRWIHPERGLIPPLDFLPTVEGTDLEIQIGGWVMNEALQQLESWQQQGVKLEVSINVSSHHLLSSAFFDQLNDALDNHSDVNSQDLQLEILESSALGDLDAISGIIKRCQNVLGVNVALDDFGTSYSSLTHMRRLSANTIKIDQSFVRDMLDDPDDYSIIEGVIGLAKAFHQDVIAEGVETDAHGLMLLIMGCNEAQGYGISHPLPAEDMPAWLADYTPNTYWMDYGKQHITPQTHKVTLLQLTTKQWFNTVTNAIRTMDNSGLGDCFKKYPLAAWLSRFEEEGLFSSTWLDKLTQAHDVMFTLAKEMVEQYQASDIEPARASLDEFERSYTTVRTILD